MNIVKVNTGRPYEVQIGPGLLSQLGEKARCLHPVARKAFVVTDETVGGHYLPAALASLNAAGFACTPFVISPGEGSKSGANYLSLLEAMAQDQITRSDLLIALGGGVVGDLGGFAAATFLRGIDFIQVPTTLLAAVDSSVGGKVAVNLPQGKNLVGAFHQPSLVLCDTDTLKTLPGETFCEGVGEVIKYAMLGGQFPPEVLQDPAWQENPREIIAACASQKRDIVERDEFDRGDRQLLNLGHTVGHAIEKCSHYTIPHGMAVAMGLFLITKAAVKKGFCPAACLEALEKILPLYGLDRKAEYDAESLYTAALGDKKRAGGAITLVVPTALGAAKLHPIPVEELRSWIQEGLTP